MEQIKKNLSRLSPTVRSRVVDTSEDDLMNLMDEQDLQDFYCHPDLSCILVVNDTVYRVNRAEEVTEIGSYDGENPEDLALKIDEVGNPPDSGAAKIVNIYRVFMDIREELGKSVLSYLNTDMTDQLTFQLNKTPGYLTYENNGYQVLVDMEDPSKDQITEIRS